MSSRLSRVVIVGASLAGTSVADALRERGFTGQVTIVGAEQELPYTRPPLSKEALADGVDAGTLALHDQKWFDDRGVDLSLGVAATDLDPRRREISFADGRVLAYDAAVIATGSAAKRLDGVGQHPRVHHLRELSDARRLREALSGQGRLVVLGGGFVGLEAAATARRMGVSVTVVEPLDLPLGRILGPQVGRWYAELHRRAGVDLRLGVKARNVDVDDGQVRVHLDTAETLVADHLLVAIGSVPNTAWLSRNALDLADGIRCTPDLSTGLPGVFAAGDVARWVNPLFGEEMRVEHWTNAVDQGRHAARSILGEDAPFDAVPYFWTDQHDAKLRFVGRSANADAVAVDQSDERTLIVRYGRRGVITGGVCVNSPRTLAGLRAAISARTPWTDSVPASTALAG
jgi:NADPH-dependent 2,4-dienoyl-CoA reductase/sulfur reductase-like enzyme